VTKLEAAAAEYAKVKAEAERLVALSKSLYEQSESLYQEGTAVRAKAWEAEEAARVALNQMADLAKEYAR
jgi:hypothetical protein